MKRMLFVWLLLGVSLSGAAEALAQSSEKSANPGAPPKVLTIFREEVKVGKGAAHEKFESNFVRASMRAKWPAHYLAMTSLSGQSEAWYMTGYDSFADWEKDRQATEKATAFNTELEQLAEKDAEFLSGGRGLTAILREDLSRRAASINASQARYMRVLTYRVRPGHEADFMEAAKIVREAHDKVSVNVPWAIYQVVSGATTPTFLVFVPLKSLSELDEILARQKALQEAEGEENMKRLQKLAAEGYLGTETNIYALSPKMSYVPEEWAAADPEFWRPKALLAGGSAPAHAKARSTGAAKKGTEKLAPATKKEAVEQPRKQ